MSLSIDSPHDVYSAVQELMSSGKLAEALSKLSEVSSEMADTQYFMLECKVLHLQGKLKKAYESALAGAEQHTGQMQLVQRKNEYQSHLDRLEKALEQIVDGKHSSDEINFAKANTQSLIDHGCFEEAIAQLRELAEARKAKTTNILWIGNYLKDVFFHPEAGNCKNQFDDLLFEEMLFYFLKSCKLFEPEYKIIQDAKKALKNKE